MHESLEVRQADIGDYTLDVVVEPIGNAFLVELILPPKKGARATAPQTVHAGHVSSLERVSDWIIEVAPVVKTKLDSAARAALLRNGYRPEAEPDRNLDIHRARGGSA